MTGVADATPAHSGLLSSDPRGYILIADDEEDIRDLIQRILRGLGYSVVGVENGEAALSQLARGEPISLIICNLRMPRLNGPALYRRVSEICPGLAERFVFCSGDLVSEASRQFLHCCARPHLEKPFDLEELEKLARRYAALPAIRLDARAMQRLRSSRWHDREALPLLAAAGDVPR